MILSPPDSATQSLIQTQGETPLLAVTSEKAKTGAAVAGCQLTGTVQELEVYFTSIELMLVTEEETNGCVRGEQNVVWSRRTFLVMWQSVFGFEWDTEITFITVNQWSEVHLKCHKVTWTNHEQEIMNRSWRINFAHRVPQLLVVFSLSPPLSLS